MNFTLPELAPLTVIDGKPSYSTLTTATAQLIANARKIPFRNGFDGHDFLCVKLSPAEMLVRFPNPAISFQAPTLPAPLGAPPPDMTKHYLFEERERVYREAMEVYQTMGIADLALKTLLMTAVNEIYYAILKHRRFSYSNVTTMQLLTHLNTNYGSITNAEREKNRQRLLTPWDPNEPIETIWNRLTEITDFADAAGGPIDEWNQIYDTLLVLRNSGVFADDIAAYERAVCDDDRTMKDFQARFNRANRVRREQRTAIDFGVYHDNALAARLNALLIEQGHLRRQLQQNEQALARAASSHAASAAPTGTTTTTPATSRRRHYCWTHGFGLNNRHTSATCVYAATATDTMGGKVTEMSPRNPANPRC
ncbi:hypothetical protein MPSEU_000144400 [Mayamaea pseudoterrestris]|nr:hypothetical protein MPSEU_000144400 [Mayamaea pseudoterrestris]